MTVVIDVVPTASDNPDAPNSVSRKSLFEGSTQFQHWRFSEAQLREIRMSLNAAAVSAIEHAFEVDLPGSSTNVSFLTPEEELLLVKLYIGKVPQLCGHFRFPEEVEATAITYLKRFYLKNTVMDWHPKNVMLTALFLASKVTNNPVSLEAYAKAIPKTAPSDVLHIEFLVAQSLSFEFHVWHAHRALWGIYLDIQSLPDCPLDKLENAYDRALSHVRASRLTDVELIYTPAQIALGALHLASPDLASSWVSSKGVPSMLGIASIIGAIIERNGVGPDVEQVRDVDKRLRLCKNPEKVVGSKAYLVKKAEEEAKAKGKRAKKAESIKRAMEEGDPFGQELSPGAADAALDDDDDD